MSSELPDLNVESEFKEIHDGVSNAMSDNESRRIDNDYHNTLELPRMERNQIVELIKRTRVSFRVRTVNEMIVDGCFWQLLGQNQRRESSRSYFHYKCIGRHGCPIRKDVERDGNISTIIYYRGKHNHAVAPAATA